MNTGEIKKEIAEQRERKDWTLKDIQSLGSFRERYKTVSSRKTDAAHIVKKWAEEITAKQRKRRRKKSDFSVREWLEEIKIEEFKRFLKSTMRLPAHYVVTVIPGHDWAYLFDKNLDWDGYSKKTKYPMAIYHIRIYMPSIDLFRKIEVSEFDGLRNFRCKKIRQIGEVSLYDVVYLKEGKGFEKSFTPCIVASNGEFHYHAETAKQAIKGLRKKIRRQQKRYDLSLDSYLSRKKYAEITGACYTGIDTWCEKHGLDPTGKMKVRKILPMLREEKPYGYEKIEKLVQ